MKKVFILSGCRTPIGSFQGKLEHYTASEMGSIVISEAIKRASIRPEDVSEVIMGQVLTAGQGQNTARQAAVNARIPYEIPAYTINMLCGSGLKAVFLAYQAIQNDDSSIVVAGGQESMTKSQHSTYMRSLKFGPQQLHDTMILDGLTDAFNNVHMGRTAEHLATKYNIKRIEQDKFALLSQQKAKKAIENGYFTDEIVPLYEKKSKLPIIQDEFPKLNLTLDELDKLKPVFDLKGSVTAGNASGLNDGAAALILCNDEQVKMKNLKPLVQIVGFTQTGLDPMEMGLGPICAIEKLLNKIQWSKDSVDLFELNEAFAVQSQIIIEQLGLDINKVNINGGAIALGHPIGASGARILVTLIYNLKRLNRKRGIAALCIGGGMGIAVAIENCEISV